MPVHSAIRNALLGFAAIAWLTACTQDAGFTPQTSPILHDPAETARADTIAIMIPGALASVGLFEPTRVWRDRGYALAYYRFPGYDDLPFDHAVGIEDAARRIAAFAQAYPAKRIRLLGYSTGGTIALRTAAHLSGRDVRVAAIAPAPENGGGLRTTIRTGRDLVTAAARARSLDREKIWAEYYRILLFGRDALREPVRAAEADRIARRELPGIDVPGRDLVRAHSADLRAWKLPPDPALPEGTARIFVGLGDPIFSTTQTARLAAEMGRVPITGYSGQGHLLFLTKPRVFEDIWRFFEAP